MAKKKPEKKKTDFGKKLKEALDAAEEKAKYRKQWKHPGANNVGESETYFL
tara:strand:+ start:5621 stop:5773 length:153 start_codon:yes stop_codon:yes gene_type:complete